jgi:hypothetical protein
MPIKWPYLVSLIFVMGASFYLFYPKIENFFIFFPESNFDLTPEDLNLNYKDVFFNTDDGKRLHGWFFPLEEELPVILFCHGNAGNISHRLDNIRLLITGDMVKAPDGLQKMAFTRMGWQLTDIWLGKDISRLTRSYFLDAPSARPLPYKWP